jgi:hypothetical protein
MREESRGSHYRTDFLERNDERFLASTIAEYDPATGESKISFEPVEYGIVTPRVRDYSKAGKKKQQPAATSNDTNRERSNGPDAAADPKAARRVADPSQEPDINGEQPTAAEVGAEGERR